MKIRPILLLLAVFVAAFVCLPTYAAEPSPADVTLKWDHADLTAVKEFRVYEQTGSTWTLVRTVTGAPLPTEVTLSDVTPGVHTYRVTAANVWGESAPSNTASTVPPAPPPSGLQVEVTVRVTVSTPK